MSEYGVIGYGIKYSLLAKFVDRQKLGVLTGWELNEDNGDEEYIYRDNADLIDEYLNNEDNITEYSKIDDTEGYIMIWSVMPFEMKCEDYKQIDTLEKTQEYIWNCIKGFLINNVEKEDIYKIMNYVDDIYGKSFNM